MSLDMLGATCLSKWMLRLVVIAAALVGMFLPVSAIAEASRSLEREASRAFEADPLSLSPLDPPRGTESVFPAFSFYQLGHDAERLDAAYPKYVSDPVVGLARDLAHDYSTQLTFPVRLAWHDPLKFCLGVAGIGALIATDRATQDFLAPANVSESENVRQAADQLSRFTDIGSSYPLVLGFFAVGVLAHSPREQETGVMLCEALVTSSSWTLVLKKATGRERPRESNGEVSDWTGPGGMFDDDVTRDAEPRSFPSGHSTGNWAVATILAHQYSGHRVIPVLAYGMATAVDYARIVLGAHWLSDVVVGGLVGYGCARQVLSAHNEKRLQSEGPGVRVGTYVSGNYRGISLRYDF